MGARRSAGNGVTSKFLAVGNHGDRAARVYPRILMHTLPKDFGGGLPLLVFRWHLCDGPYIPI